MRYLIIAASFLFSLAACAQESQPPAVEKYIEGTHYMRLAAPVPSIVDTTKQVEVTEVFRFGCPACARFEDAIGAWKQSKPAYIAFHKNPVVWNDVTERRAAVYFAGKALGLEQETSAAIFDAIHEKATSKREANTALTKEEDILAMFVSLGADQGKAEKMLKSFGVKSMVNKADGRARSFAVTGTPEIFVDGRYRVTVSSAGSFEQMLAIASFVAEKIAKERGIID